MKVLLIIGHIFPEPTTTAAGTRMLQLITMFQKVGYSIVFASTASISEKSLDLSTLGITSEIVQLNHPSFDAFVGDLDPTMVLFDRFITEEQFGWRVAEVCPSALRILDTEDLHFLRKARQQAFKDTGDAKNANLYTDFTKRELASILRCDLSLIISEFEMQLLLNTFNLSKEILYYLPFVLSEIPQLETLPAFETRAHFMTIGNLYHAPNVDSVLYLKNEIWPLIKKQLPKVDLYVYGNYAPQHIEELHNEQEGFYIKGWASSVKEVMEAARICLAPIRFGAGLKGKLLDAMLYGTPAVTTIMGAEGMYGKAENAGGIANTAKTFANLSVTLYTEKQLWEKNQKKGLTILQERYHDTHISEVFITSLKKLKVSLKAHRHDNFIGQILQHQNLQASKYMSKWIEEKNK